MLGELLVVLEELPVCCAAHAYRKCIIGELEFIAERAAGLQREGAQAEGEGAAQPARRVGERVHDAGVGEGLAAAGGGHIDDECALPGCGFAHRLGEVRRAVLPAEAGIGTAFAQALVADQSWQVMFETG